MKFLRSTATDFFAHRAQFLFLAGSPEFKAEGEITTKETAQENLHLDTQERLDMLGYETQYLSAANEANKSVNEKLPKFWEALQGLTTPVTEAQVRPIAGEYLVNKTLPTPEMRKMYRTEMFASFRATLSNPASRATLSNFTDTDISTLLLSGMSEVYTYQENKQSVAESLSTASRMIKYDKDHSGINVTEWVSGANSIMAYKNEMSGSAVNGTVDASGKLVINGKAYDIQGCEILTGAAMMDYPKSYLTKFTFQNLISRGNRVMARVENGCHGNLATFLLDGDPNLVPTTIVNPDVIHPIPVIPPAIDTDPGCLLPQAEDINPCDEHTAEQIWNGIEGGDPAAMALFKEMSGGVEANVEGAREAYLTLYGRREKGKNGMNGVEKDGIYVVLEKYFNPKLQGGVFGMIRRLVKDRSLPDELSKAGYSGDEIANLMVGMASAEQNLDTIEQNATNFSNNLPEKYKHQDAGVVKDFLLRLGAGAVVGTAVAAAFAFPVGWAIPALLGGASLVQFRGGIKKFTQYPDVNSVYKTLSTPNANSQDIAALIGAEENLSEQPKSYLDIQRDAMLSVDMQNFIANDALDADIVLLAGSKPDWEKIKNQNLMSDTDINRYKEQATNGKEVEKQTGKLLSGLAENGYYFAEGAQLEGEQAQQAKKFRLSGAERRTFDQNLDDAIRAFNPEVKKEKYTQAMSALVKQLNESAQDMLDVSWRPGLTMKSLEKAFEHGQEFYLGTLPKDSRSGINRELYVKFIPNSTSQATNTGAAGRWEMYIRENGQNVESTRREYRSASDLIGKKAKKFTIDDLRALNFDPEQRFTSRERNDLLDRLNTFDLIAGQLAQINEAKDQMTMTVWNEQRTQETAKIKNQFKVEMRDEGTRTETQEEYQYRIAVASKLAKFQTWEKFEKHIGVHFSKDIQTLIKDVYDKKPGSLEMLVKNEQFQDEMACLTRGMQMCQSYLSVNDLSECSNYVKKNMYLSGQAAGRESKYHTVTFGDLYLGYLVAQGALNSEITKTITEIFHYDTGMKNEAGEAIFYDMAIEKQISEKVRQWATKGWLDNAAKKAIIAVSGGRVTNMMIDGWANNPER